MDEKFEAQRDKIKLSTETELLIRDRGKKEPRTPDILHSSINLLEWSVLPLLKTEMIILNSIVLYNENIKDFSCMHLKCAYYNKI